MKPRTILFASPNEPSGASWLLNCFLELDIKVCHKPVVENVWRAQRGRVGPSHMWQTKGDAVSLQPRADIIRKWLPALSRRNEFRFRPDCEVLYVQDFAGPSHGGSDTIFFVRDPRDAIYSAYRRANPALSFPEFVDLPHPHTLLDRADNWAARVRSWQTLGGVEFFRFEDYKADAKALLERILDTVDIEASPAAIDRAVTESDFLKAREAERRYRERYPGDRVVANRAGRIGDWRDRSELAGCMERIERRTAPLMEQFSYANATHPARKLPFELGASLAELDFFRTTTLRTSTPADDRSRLERERSLAWILSFARRVDEDLLKRSRLTPDLIRSLLDSLVEITRRHEPALEQQLVRVRTSFEEGSAYHFQRLRELIAERRPAR